MQESIADEIVNSSFDAIITKTLDGVITSWNPAAEDLYGYAAKDAIGQPMSIIVSPENLKEIKNILKKIRLGEHISRHNTRRKTKNGTVIDVSISVSPIKNQQGKIVGASVIAHDMTQEIQAEEKFRRILEATPDAMVIINKSGIITFINTQTERLFGYSKKELLGQLVEILIPETYRHRHPEHRKNYFNSPRVRPMGIGMELYGQRKNGEVFPIEISLSPLDGREGVDGVAAIRDISERKLAEERFRRILEATPDAMVIIDREGNINFINTQIEKLFGYSKNELLGKPIEIFIPESLRARHPEHRSHYFSAPRVRPMGTGMALYGQRKNGDIFPVEISLSPLETREGMVAVAAIRDITSQKQSEEKLKQLIASLERSNNELEHFAHIASHDLQEPLRMVASYTQLLEKKYNDKLDEEAREFIRYAVDGAFRMQQLITDLLAYSRVTTQGKAFVPINCETLMQEVTHHLQLAIQETRAIVEYRSLPTIKGDYSQFLQLFQNLINNAIKFHGDALPHVTISVQLIDKMWEFRFADNGIGIAPEYFDKVFVIFQRLHNRKKYPGTGVGLAICKKIVERHGGKIWVESTLGQGATVCFTIPEKI